MAKQKKRNVILAISLVLMLISCIFTSLIQTNFGPFRFFLQRHPFLLYSKDVNKLPKKCKKSCFLFTNGVGHQRPFLSGCHSGSTFLYTALALLPIF